MRPSIKRRSPQGEETRVIAAAHSAATDASGEAAGIEPRGVPAASAHRDPPTLTRCDRQAGLHRRGQAARQIATEAYRSVEQFARLPGAPTRQERRAVRFPPPPLKRPWPRCSRAWPTARRGRTKGWREPERLHAAGRSAPSTEASSRTSRSKGSAKRPGGSRKTSPEGKRSRMDGGGAGSCCKSTSSASFRPAHQTSAKRGAAGRTRSTRRRRLPSRRPRVCASRLKRVPCAQQLSGDKVVCAVFGSAHIWPV